MHSPELAGVADGSRSSGHGVGPRAAKQRDAAGGEQTLDGRGVHLVERTARKTACGAAGTHLRRGNSTRREPWPTSGAPAVAATSALMASATSGGKGAVFTV